MNFSFFLLAIFVIGLVPFAFADYRGEDYLDIDYENGTHLWTGGLSPLIPTNEIDNQGRTIYKHYYVSDQPTYVSVQNGEASFVFDKLTCSAKIYNGGLINDSNDFVVGSDSYVPKSSVNGSGSWSIVTSVNNAPCITEIIETENSIEVSGTKQSSAGIFKIRYVKEEGKELKTILEATNLTALTDRRFGITQTQSIPQMIVWAGQQIDLENYVGQTFDRTWLEDNKSKLSNLFIYGKLKFDVIDAWDNLESIKVNSISNGMASISFNYLRNTPILLPNQTLVIDPVFGYNAGTIKTILDTGCNGVPDSSSTQGYVGANSGPTTCYLSAYYFDITSIPDTDYVIESVSFRSDTTENGGTGITTCPVKSIEGNVSTMTDQQIEDDIKDGTLYTTLTTQCNVNANDYVVSTASMATDLQNELVVDNEWGIGIYGTNYIDLQLARIVNPELQVVYISIPLLFEVNDLETENIGDAFSINGNLTVISGYFANVTSIVYYVNGTAINTNSTIQNMTTYPQTINFGPFFYQQITDSLYNHTVTVSVQNKTGTYSNYTSDLLVREYDPDYFIALDPTQGLVNYTFPDGNNSINVNRDTSGSVFNIECQYFTQAQAFFDELEDGVWDNRTNVLFYVGDTSGYYYVRCFNDGELFVTGISQNYSNALVPGLVIFDQLGGFFGAPSIILVIISILSLGTGRNYPIIMLIAASVTGILLALELLVLDPGLVVALIVMTGIGLFGIRKFY